MKPLHHLIFSSIMALIWYLITFNPLTTLVFWLSAIFIDLDHLLDYFIFYPKEIFKPLFFLRERLSYFMSSKYYKKKTYVILHSLELVIALFIIAILLKNQILLAISLGFLFHLFLDFIGNIYIKGSVKNLPFYFLSYRIANKFEVKKLLNRDKF
ncbi:MAG: hypothetical protein PWP03_286 [Candidatus Woesearchaeota archaeon]|nr:hypothetical protein [Candidatus Woesearchaeota archaeon]